MAAEEEEEEEAEEKYENVSLCNANNYPGTQYEDSDNNTRFVQYESRITVRYSYY